jgi:hypothetical protein
MNTISRLGNMATIGSCNVYSKQIKILYLGATNNQVMSGVVVCITNSRAILAAHPDVVLSLTCSNQSTQRSMTLAEDVTPKTGVSGAIAY